MLNFNMLLAPFVCLILGQQASDSQEDWASYLKDAITKSESNAREGRAHVLVEYESEFEGKSFKAELAADIEWSGELLYETYAISSPVDYPFNVSQPAGLRASPRNNLLISPTEVVLYNGLSRVLALIPKADPGYAPILHLHPKLVWFAGTPPLGTTGRPWTGMLEYLPRDKSGATAVITFTREDDIIHMRRVDPGGFEVHLYFSLALGGNIVRKETKPSARYNQLQRATYHWVRQGEGFVLESCRSESNFGGPQNKPYKYHVVYSSVKLGPQSPSQFTLSRVRDNVVGKTHVRDHVANRSYYIPGKAENVEDVTDQLVGIVLSRGFARSGGDSK